MKETGVIRRIDELGRIVIPKEIRKKLKIRNGDSIDIYIEQDKVVLEKYSPLKDLETITKVLLDTFKKTYNSKIIITDMTKVISSTIQELNNTILEEEYIKIIENRKKTDLNHTIKLNKNYTINSSTKILPLIIYGDLFGSIIILECNNRSEEQLNLINLFICDYLES